MCNKMFVLIRILYNILTKLINFINFALPTHNLTDNLKCQY